MDASRKPRPSTARSSISVRRLAAQPPSRLAADSSSQPADHGAFQPQAVRRQADRQAQGHARQLHQREQEARLHQRHARAPRRSTGKAGGSLPTCSAALMPPSTTSNAGSSRAHPQASRFRPGQALVFARRETVRHAGDVVGHGPRDVGRWPRNPAGICAGSSR